MESNDSLLAELKKLTQELASHKIELYQTRSYLQCILQNSTDLIFAIDAEGPLGNHGFQILEGKDKTANPSVSKGKDHEGARPHSSSFGGRRAGFA